MHISVLAKLHVKESDEETEHSLSSVSPQTSALDAEWSLAVLLVARATTHAAPARQV